MGQSSNTPPAPPNYARDYQTGIDVYLKNLPQLLDTEAQYRQSTDPQRIADQQSLQAQFGSTQYQQQLDALHQLDPQSPGLRQLLATQVGNDLALGTQLDPQTEKMLTNSVRGAQAARGNDLGNASSLIEAEAKLNAGNALQQQRITNVGNFLNGPTPEQQLLAVQGVQPDRSMAYVNPNAGTAGVNFGAQNYQNLLAAQQLQNNNNPWKSALGGAAAGASAGAAAGPYGALIGGVAGGALGYFSDTRLKTDIREIGKTKSGIPLIRFKYLGSNKLFIGARAQDVKKVRPDAVLQDESGFLKVNYDALPDVPFFELGRN